MLRLLSLPLFLTTLRAHAWTVYFPNGERADMDSNEVEAVCGPDRFKLIFPGTKWCGSGNIADSYDDLGRHRETDACCREHDNCPEVIESGSTEHGLTNPSVYTRLHCDCDQNFFKCLKDAAINEKTSEIIGLLYFDVLHTQCFRKDYPIIGCNKYSKIPYRCQEYAFNRTETEKQWQWFDLPLF